MVRWHHICHNPKYFVATTLKIGRLVYYRIQWEMCKYPETFLMHCIWVSKCINNRNTKLSSLSGCKNLRGGWHCALARPGIDFCFHCFRICKTARLLSDSRGSCYFSPASIHDAPKSRYYCIRAGEQKRSLMTRFPGQKSWKTAAFYNEGWTLNLRPHSYIEIKQY